LPWPESAYALLEELRAWPGRLALVVDEGAQSVAERIALAWETQPLPVGRLLTTSAEQPSLDQIREQVADGEVFIDLEILFSPELQLDVLGLFRRLARSRPRIYAWPGRIEGAHASFSALSRRDRYEGALSDAIVLRARPARFPDEVPYEIERIP
jgi:hypothetical protein